MKNTLIRLVVGMAGALLLTLGSIYGAGISLL